MTKYIRDVHEQSTDESVWTQERGSNKRLNKIT
jgi:hypothetical protein